MSGLLGFSRQAYYQHEARHFTSEEREQQVLALVAQVREEYPRMGGKKLCPLLQEPLVRQGIKLGRDALFDFLSATNLLVKRRRRTAVNTFSRHQFRNHSKLIKHVALLRPNQVWVAHITYWFTEAGCFYISLLANAYSHRVWASP